jgi:hypothetical protein
VAEVLVKLIVTNQTIWLGAHVADVTDATSQNMNTRKVARITSNKTLFKTYHPMLILSFLTCLDPVLPGFRKKWVNLIC